MQRTWAEPLRRTDIRSPSHPLLDLQRQAGNGAVARLLQVARRPAFRTTSAERRATFRATLQELKAKDKALAKLADPLLAVLK